MPEPPCDTGYRNSSKEMPLAVQIHNAYRSRAISHWLQTQGISLIPVSRWADIRSFEFCFDGLPIESTLAVGTHGTSKHRDDKRYFVEGLFTMLSRLRPHTLIVYGTITPELFPPLLVSHINIVQYESDCSRAHQKEVTIDGRR